MGVSRPSSAVFCRDGAVPSIFGLAITPGSLHRESDAAVFGGTVPVASDGAKRGSGPARMHS